MGDLNEMREDGIEPPEKDIMDVPNGEGSKPLHAWKQPRIYVRKDVVDRLVKLGIPEDPRSISNAVNSLADMGISLGLAYLPDATDLVVMEQALTDRTEELTQVSLDLGRLLVELGATSEYRTLFYNLKNVVKSQGQKG